MKISIMSRTKIEVSNAMHKRHISCMSSSVVVFADLSQTMIISLRYEVLYGGSGPQLLK